MGFVKRFLRGQIAEKEAQIRDWNDPDREQEPTVCDEIRLEGIDKDLYAKLLAEATAGGIQFDGTKAQLHSGPISLEFRWEWDQTSAILTVQCTKKPFIFSCSQVQERIEELVAKAKGGV